MKLQQKMEEMFDDIANCNAKTVIQHFLTIILTRRLFRGLIKAAGSAQKTLVILIILAALMRRLFKGLIIDFQWNFKAKYFLISVKPWLFKTFTARTCMQFHEAT